ncbi:MAG: TolC family protein, partial [Anaeromyxobacteraceae bacterium]
QALLDADREAVEAARDRLRLAEARYANGAGSALELSDAQLAQTNAEAQLVQAEYKLGQARATLLRALGRSA